MPPVNQTLARTSETIAALSIATVICQRFIYAFDDDPTTKYSELICANHPEREVDRTISITDFEVVVERHRNPIRQIMSLTRSIMMIQTRILMYDDLRSSAHIQKTHPGVELKAPPALSSKHQNIMQQ